MRKISLVSLLLFTLSITAFSQESDSNEQKLTRMQEEINFLKKQLEFEKTKGDLTAERIKDLRESIPNSSAKPLSGKTTFTESKESNFESISLSYEALKEISSKISSDMQNDVSQYSGLVLYNEPDFISLSKYRLYRNQARIALRNYQSLINLLKKLTAAGERPDSGQNEKFSIKTVDPLMTALSIPSLGTSYATSIAELFSVFRSETNITESAARIDESSLGAVMANVIRKNNPNVKIYFPQAFVAEYVLDEEGEDSLFRQITQINSANFTLGEIVLQISKLPAEQRNSQEVKDILSMSESVKKQLQGLAIESKTTGTDSNSGVAKTNTSEFRELIRAEKLDQFLEHKSQGLNDKQNVKNVENEKIGILKLRVISSGGSRRETRNLFLGSKTDFSGSVIVEIILFNVDGSLQKSDVYSLHTGFRKMQRNENPK